MKKLAGLVAVVALVVAGAAMWGGDTAEAESKCFSWTAYPERGTFCTTTETFQQDCINAGGTFTHTSGRYFCTWVLSPNSQISAQMADGTPPAPPTPTPTPSGPPSYCKSLGWLAVFVKACR